MPNNIQKVKDEGIEEFEKEFTFVGEFGEKLFSIFRPEDFTKDSPIFRNDKVIEDLENFIRSHQSALEQTVREEIIDKVSRIFGSHESPHTDSNCRLCKIKKLKTLPNKEKE